MIIKRVVHVFRDGGMIGLLGAVARRLAMPRARSFVQARDLVRGGTGLEIGGPSPMFSRGGLLPLYPHAARVDNCNFTSATLWEGTIAAGDSFVFDRRKAPGRQLIGEGGELAGVPDAQYDFLLSSHMLEHSANPLRALATWRRVLRPGGTLVLVLPHHDGVFDHLRPLTTIAHLKEDFGNGTGEGDTTHVEEILALHDVSRDPGAGDMATFRARALDNAGMRSLHHHVFDGRLAVAALEDSGFMVAALEMIKPYHIMALARTPGGVVPAVPMSPDARAAALQRSPFATDRR